MYKVRAFQKVLTYKNKDRIIQLSYFSNGCTMKERLTYFLFISLFCCNVFAQNVEYVTYCEDFVSRPSAIHYTPLRAKAMRKSSNHGGQITVSYNSPTPDSLKQAIEIAVLLWEECLPINANIKLDVSFETISSDMKVSVPYMIDTDNSLLYTSSYFKSYYGYENQYADGNVFFSDTVNWCCSYSQESGNFGVCLTTAMLRAIAITLGFGSTVKKIDPLSICFSYVGNEFSPFEHLIYNSYDVPLTSIPKGNKRRDNQELHAYVESADTLWVKFGNNRYNLYAPVPFEDGKSLVFLNEAASLMHHEMPWHRHDNYINYSYNRMGY